MIMVANLADMRRAAGETASPFEALLAQPAAPRFDVDAYHAMQERDSALIADSVLNGHTGKEYVYSFQVGNKTVAGISVVGASALAAEYKGIKTRIVSAFDKTGPLFVMRTFDPPSMQVQNIPELEDQADFYEVVIEVTDLKTGNSIQKRKKEAKLENGRVRPHYDVIAESKAYRNAVLAIIPQDVVSKFEKRALDAGHAEALQTKGERIAGMLKFSAKNGVAISRATLERLTYDQIDGLSQAARESVESFRRAAVALGIAETAADPATGEIPPPAAQAQQTPPAQQPAPAAAPAPAQQQPATQAPPADEDDGLDDWRVAFGECQTDTDCDELIASYRGKPGSDEAKALRALCAQQKKKIAADGFGGGE